MALQRFVLFAVALSGACGPSTPIFLPVSDADERQDGTSDRPSADAASDMTVPIDVPTIDIAATDTAPALDAQSQLDVSPALDIIVATDAAPPRDAPGESDVVPVVDVIAKTDALATEDAPDAGAVADAGRCPVGMVLVSAGQFMMGDLISDNPEARPVHGVRLTEFCLDETLVTIAAYQACVTAGVCTPPATTASCNWGVTGREQHPANCTNWNQARAYCQWRGGDLPTEARWEYAARGMDGRTYPWGNDDPSAQLCWSGGGTRRAGTCAVGSFRAGNAPNGIADMAGNVWEWTLDWYGEYPIVAGGTYILNPIGPMSGGGRVVRGASWSDASPRDFRAATRSYYAPGSYSQYHGFRCARGAS